MITCVSTTYSDLKESIHQLWQFNETFVSDQQLMSSSPRSNSSVSPRKVRGGDVEVWFVARSMFLTEHWNIPVQITRWITASLQGDMLDTLFCYLSFNRLLIALLSGRCLRSTLYSVTHSPDLIVFLMVEASVARHWRNDAAQAVSIFRETVEKASLIVKTDLIYFLYLYNLRLYVELSEDLVVLSTFGICVIYLFISLWHCTLSHALAKS